MRMKGLLSMVLVLGLGLGACTDAPTAPTHEASDALTDQVTTQKFGKNALPDGLTIEDVTGELSDGGSLAGDVTVQEMWMDGNQLMVGGQLTGTATEADGTTTAIDQAFEAPATLGSSRGSKCDLIFLDLGPIFLDVLGLQVDLSQITLDIDAIPGQGNLLGNLLCAVAGLLDPNSGVANLLDRISDVLDDIGGLLTTVTGSLTDAAGDPAGSFDGAATINSISLEDGVVTVSGVLNGVATLADGSTEDVVNQAFEVAASLTASHGSRCDLVFLDLGPIFLDVLGLQVDLSQITLDVDAVSGQGNLLGNLLCAVAGLLDPGSGLANLLDRITGLLGG